MKQKLGNLIDIKHGFAFKGEFFKDTPTPNLLLTPGNFKIGGGFQYTNSKYYDGPIPNDYLLEPGDLIVTMTDLSKEGDTLGFPAILPKINGVKYLHNQRIGLISKKNDEIDLLYLFQLMRTREYQRFIFGTSSGATVHHTSPSRIYQYEVDLPILPVQKKIGLLLFNYENLITANLNRIDVLEQIAQLLYQEWFVEFRFPGYEKHKFVDSELGKIPEGWELHRVVDLVKRYPPGKLFDTYSVVNEGNVPVLDQGQTGVIGFHNEAPGFIASLSDPVIIFANHTCYQKIIHYPFSSIQNVIPFKSSDDYQRNIYWLHFATHNLVQLNDYKGHWPEFMSKQVLLPDNKTCDEFGAIVGECLKQIYLLEQTNVTLVKMRDLLLPKLMSGEIDVSKLDIKVN